jgi:hypothetical protein
MSQFFVNYKSVMFYSIGPKSFNNYSALTQVLKRVLLKDTLPASVWPPEMGWGMGWVGVLSK